MGRRAAKRSVDRSYIKRRARDLFRRHPAKRAGMDLVVTLTSRFEVARTDALVAELTELLDRIPPRMPA